MSIEERFKGLQWVPGELTPDPVWTIKPDLESIRQTVAEYQKSHKISVSEIHRGISQIYEVRVDNQVLVMRVYLPLDPENKTLSEVATVNWTRRHTSLPVPNIIAYQASRENAIKFEWTLVEKIQGKSLKDSWRTMQYSVKEQLVQQIAAYFSSSYKHRLLGIGNIYPGGSELSQHRVERIVSMPFFWANHILQDVPRGPFRTTKDWFSAWLLIHKNDCNSILAKPENGYDDEKCVKDAKGVLRVVERLESHLSEFFPDDCADPETTMLINDDLSKCNMLVDENGILTGVLDWQCVTALPLWKTCYYPSFIEGPPRDEKPDPNEYSHSDDENSESLYWQHLREYEHTKLRQYFLDEMRRLEPDWVEIFDSSAVKRDFHFAVECSNIGFLADPINEWLDDVDRNEGTVRSLTNIMEKYCAPRCCE